MSSSVPPGQHGGWGSHFFTWGTKFITWGINLITGRTVLNPSGHHGGWGSHFFAWGTRFISWGISLITGRAVLIPPGHPDGWGTSLLTNIDTVATWGNNQKTRILIVSPQPETDRKYVETVLAKESKTNKIVFGYFEGKDKKGMIQDENIFLDKFKDFFPTTVIQYPPGNVAQILYPENYFSQILLKNPTSLFIETLNVWNADNKWNREECILTSMAPVNKLGVEEQLKKARKDAILENTIDTRVLIISGGHGGPFKDGRVTPAGGVSCFSEMKDLEYGFYKEDCETIGIIPTADICQYKNPNDKNKVTSVGQTKIKPRPGSCKLDKNIKALNKDPQFNKIIFDIVNIAHYGAYNGKRRRNHKTKNKTKQNQKNLDNVNKLVAYLEDFKPTFIAIAWCFSSNGDLAMALRSQGFFSKLLLEHELRKITKDPKAKLSDQQLNILKKAALDLDGNIQYKDFHLVGNSGVGKTELGLEISKMKMAQLGRQGSVNLLVMTQKSDYQTPKALLKKLESDLNGLANAYETRPQFCLMPEIIKTVADECKTVEDLFKLINHYYNFFLTWPIVRINRNINTVILLDEVKISETEDGEMMIRDFTKLQDLGYNVHTIYCHSPLTGSKSANVQFHVKLPTTKLGKVYSEQLEIRYRNNERILEFLHFLSNNRVEISYETTHTKPVFNYTGIIGFRFSHNYQTTQSGIGTPHDGFLSDANDKLATSLPITLSGSPHPVLWVDCAWDWEKMDQRLTRGMMYSLVPDMVTWEQRSGQVVSGMVIYGQGGIERDQEPWFQSNIFKTVRQLDIDDEEMAKTWRCLSRENCAGMEADLVITVGNIFHYEPIARARQQIIVLTGIDTDDRIKACLEKAKNKGVLARRNMAEKPECIHTLPLYGNGPLNLIQTKYDVNGSAT